MNRYAWTNMGPVRLENGKYYNTAHCRRWLEQQKGIKVDRWARNFMAFIGWHETSVYMPNPFAY